LAILSKIRTFLTATIAPRLDSLAARLIAAAAVWTVAGLVVGGLILSGVFRASEEASFDARLKFDLDGMIAAAEPDPAGGVSLRGRFTDPRFERIFSGWYWQITPADGRSGEMQISRSLWDHAIHVTGGGRAGPDMIWGRGEGPDDQHLRIVEQRIEFPISATSNPDDTRAYTFLVAGNLAQLESEVARFDTMLFWSFAVLGLGLIAAIFIQVRVGLTPLRRLSRALSRIRDGGERKLEGRYPAELAPIAAEINSLIAHSAEVVGRARGHVSNLAHFLKTPLTVLASEADAQPGPLADSVLGNRTPVKPVLDDLARVLMRIHAERAIAIEVDCSPSLAFRGERQDLEEMAGNLIDNACKWAHSKVAVKASRDGAKWKLVVGDDGAGLDAEERSHVGERGERLDESVPGSGLGLSIVRDIARLYGGSFELGESPLGGLEARLVLPVIG